MINVFKNHNNSLFCFLQRKNPGTVLLEDTKGTSRRSLTAVKVLENTHTDGEEERGTRGGEGTGGGM